MKNKSLIIDLIKQNYLLLIILFVAAFLRFYKLDYQSLWLDELYTMNVANPNTGFVEMIKDITVRESFPYLYFIIVKIFFFLFGHESLVARIPSAVFGVLSVWMIYKLGKELVTKQVGLIAAVLITCSQYAVYNSQDARAYSFYLFFTILSYSYLYKFIQFPSKKSAIKYALSAGLLLNTNFFAVSNVFVQGLLILIFLVLLNDDKKVKIQNFKFLLLSVIITFLLFTPNVYKFYLATQFYSDWIPAPTNGGVTMMLKEMVCDSEFSLFLFGILLVFYLLNAFEYSNSENIVKQKIDKKVLVFIILTSWIALPLLIVVVKSYTGTPLYITRYLYSILPAIFLIFAASLNEIKNSIIKYFLLLLLVFSLLFDMVVVKKYYRQPNKSQFREASQIILDNNNNNETVYTGLKYWFDYYLSHEKRNFDLIEVPNLDAVINEMIIDSSKIKPFWYTDAHGRPYKLSDKSQKFVDSKLYIDESFDGLDAWTKHFILEKDAVSKFDLKSFLPLKVQNGDLTKVWVEVFEEETSGYKISGWGFLENIDSKNNKISIVLINNLESKVLKCQQFPRTDITNFEKDNINYDNSGFITNIQTEKLQKGNYKVAILIENKKVNKNGLYLTDKKIIIN